MDRNKYSDYRHNSRLSSHYVYYFLLVILILIWRISHTYPVRNRCKEETTKNFSRCLLTVTRCSPLNVPNDGVVTLSSGSGYCSGGAVYGSICSTTCNIGYELSSGQDFQDHTCNRSLSDPVTGFWTGDDVSCDREYSATHCICLIAYSA